jgi:hypothetical protein
MGILEKRITETLKRRCSEGTETGFIVFSKKGGAVEKPEDAAREGKIVAQSSNARSLIEVLARGGAYG